MRVRAYLPPMNRPSYLAAAPSAHPGVWTADALAGAGETTLPSGHAALDAELPGGGWPRGAMVEILQLQPGQGEWRLLLPALAAAPPGPVVLVGAPHAPFGPALAAQGLAPERLLCITSPEPAARLWACEQALRCADVAGVLAWLPQVRAEQLRRLHLAAAQQSKLLFVMRPAPARQEASPAPLRLLATLPPQEDALQIEIFKRRGPPLATPLRLPARQGRLATMLGRYAAPAPARGEAPVQPPRPALVLVPGAVAGGKGHALDRVAGAS